MSAPGKTSSRPFSVWLVEDSVSDIELTKLALQRGSIPCQLTPLLTGEEALAQLEKNNQSYAPLPDLILLDLNLPGINGNELLAVIKSDERFRSVPVVILTTSKSHHDIRRAYQSHANAFMCKPADFDVFAELIERTISFWFRAALLPTMVGTNEL